MFNRSGTLIPQRRRRAWTLPSMLMLLALLTSGAGVYLALRQSQTEPVLAWARTVAAGQPVTQADLMVLDMARARPAELATLPADYPIVGMWATQTSAPGELVRIDQISQRAPQTPFYPNGAELPADMVALPFSTQTVGPLTDQDTINVNFIDASGDPQRCTALGGAVQTNLSAAQIDAQGRQLPITCRLLPQMQVLYIDAEREIAYLAATPYQSQAVYTLSALADVQLYGERYGSTSTSLPYLTMLSPSTLQAELLTGAVSITNPLLPGIRLAAPTEGGR